MHEKTSSLYWAKYVVKLCLKFSLYGRCIMALYLLHCTRRYDSNGIRAMRFHLKAKLLKTRHIQFYISINNES